MGVRERFTTLGVRGETTAWSHIIMAKEGRRVVVPNHNPIKIGTLRSIITQAGLTVDQFLASL